MSASRTKNSARNASVATVAKVVNLLASFACRTVFIEVLGTEYLGINGLFSNILRVLSFAELGAGMAIVYKMFKPIADGDKERIKTIVHFYKKVYGIIGAVIFVSGLILMPFLHFLIKDDAGIGEGNILIFYILFLANSSMSYFFAHKKSLISGHQNEHILSFINLVSIVITNVLEIVFLLLTHNYIAYLIMQILGTLLENILVSRKANKLYPYINDREYQKISRREQKAFFKDLKYIFSFQMGSILWSGTDNIIVSAFIGVAEVGLLSNYTLITTSITSLIDSMFNSLAPSIGNLNTIEEKAKKEKVFYQILFILFVAYGYIAIMVALLINKFIVIWLGEDYVLGASISIVLGIDMFVAGMRYVYYTYRNTMGLFKKGAFLPIVSSLANVLLSILLVNVLPAENHWKIFGVLLATPVARLLIQLAYEPIIIHKYAFKTSPSRYYKKYAYYMFVVALAGVISFLVIRLIPLEGILGFVVDGLIATGIVMLIFWLFSVKLKEYREVKEKIYRLARRKL